MNEKSPLNKPGEMKTGKDSPSPFSIPDNMCLQISDIESSEITEKDDVSFLTDQIQDMKTENTYLKKLLDEKELEKQQILKQKELEMLALSGGKLASDAASAKIVELSRKIREITATLESEKTKTKQLTRRIYELENKPKIDFGKSDSSGKSDSTSKKEESQLKALQEKLQQASVKLSEYRNQCQILKQDLKLTHKALVQEVGDDANIQTILNNPSNWRGRSQQILALQTKISELKAQIESQNQTNGEEPVDRKNNPLMKSLSNRNMLLIKKIEKEKKEEQEKAAADLQELQSEFSYMKEKLEGCKARNKILSREINSLKAELAKLIEKGEHDEELISALMEKLSSQEELMNNSTRGFDRNESQLIELQRKDNDVISKLKSVIEEKDEQIRYLEDELLRLQKNSEKESTFVRVPLNRGSSLSSPCGNNSASLLNRRPTSFSPSEKNDLIHPSSKSSEFLRENSASRCSLSRLSKTQDVSHDIQDLEELEELRTMCHEYRAVAQAAQVEKEKLMELVKVLNKRLEETNKKALDAELKIQEQRRQNVQLEKQLGKASLEWSNKSSNKTLNFPTDSLNSYDHKINIEKLKEDNEILKSALHSCLQQKEDDLKAYQDIIDKTRQIFTETLKQHEYVK